MRVSLNSDVRVWVEFLFFGSDVRVWAECLFHAVLFFDPAEMPREDLQCSGQNDPLTLDSALQLAIFAGFNCADVNICWIQLVVDV
ncbi:MAG: hypothetical protein OIF58_00480 [Cohaesibacter sp.]|nr:hypothetical protein [Cohaesibacter sp.]